MKSLIIHVLFCFLFHCSHSYALTFTAAINGNWNDGATWGNASPGSVGVDFPGAADAANIPITKNVTIPSGYTANATAVAINSSSANGPCSLMLADATASLSVSGDMNMNSFSIALSPSTYECSFSLNGGTATIGGNLTATSKDNGTAIYNQSITIGAGTLTVSGNLTLINNNTATATLNMNTANSVLNVGGTFNIGVLNNGTGANGTINYNGTGSQTILSAITYYDLTISGGGLKTLDGNATIKNTLTMTSGNVNLGSYTLTLGSSGASAGSLSHTNGWLYNGSFKRWMADGLIAIGNSAGHFPMGGRSGDGSINRYRPLWIGQGPDLTGPNAGTITVTHTPDFSWPAYTAASHNDASWGETLQGVSKSIWAVSTGDGYIRNATSGSIRFGGEGFGTNVTTDLNASLLASVVRNHSATTGTGTEPYVNRINLTSTDFVNDWRIGTKNASQSPLPVELLGFDAKYENEKVVVTWITATETNNDFFTVEAAPSFGRQRLAEGDANSPEGGELMWHTVGIVSGAGNSTTVLDYSLIDYSPPFGRGQGWAYYRLKQTDFDGACSYSNIVAVNFEGSAISESTIYPNPLLKNQVAYLKLNNEISGKAFIIIQNSLGLEIFRTERNIEAGESLYMMNELTKFSSGAYHFIILLEDWMMSKTIVIL